MNDNLSCELVQDLLPSYVDGLTSKVTNQAVEKHVSACAACAEVLRQMRRPEQDMERMDGTIDYLKKVRRHHRRTILAVILCAFALLCSVIGIRSQVIGDASAGADLSITVTGNKITVDGVIRSEGQSYLRTVFQERYEEGKEGVINLSIYTARRYNGRKTEFHAEYTAYGAVNGIYVNGVPVSYWRDGVRIDAQATQLFFARHPYIGDMPSNGRVSDALKIWESFGPFTNQLQTAETPYGWTLKLEYEISDAGAEKALAQMKADACGMLAAIDNLCYVTWEYRTSHGVEQYTITEAEATEAAGREIKSCAESPESIQALLETLGWESGSAE